MHIERFLNLGSRLNKSLWSSICLSSHTCSVRKSYGQGLKTSTIEDRRGRIPDSYKLYMRTRYKSCIWSGS